MSAPDFNNLLMSLGGDGLNDGPAVPMLPPLPSVPIASPAAPIAVPPPPPMPSAAPPGPPQLGLPPVPTMPHSWADAIGPLAAVLLAATGHPFAATGAGRGALLAEEQKRQDFEQQQKLAIELQQRQVEIAKFQAEQEAKRQAGIQSIVMDAQKQLATVKKKDDYDQIVNGLESYGAQAYGMRPNTIRTAFPYRAPDFMDLAKSAGEQWIKNPANEQALKDGNFTGSIMVDALGDGHPIPIPLGDVLTKTGLVAMDPTTGKPLPIAARKDENAKFDPTIFAGVKSQWVADHQGQQPNAQALATITTQAIKQTAAAAKPPIDPIENALHVTQLSLANAQLNQLTGNSIDQAAQAVINHQMSPSQAVQLYGGRDQGAFRKMLTSRILTSAPDFNFEQAEANYKFGSNPTTQNTVRYMTSVQESMPLLLQRAQQLNNGRVRSLNALVNMGKDQFNNVDLKQFQTDVLLVSDEVAKILQGGGTGNGTSDAKLRAAQGILNTSDSPQAIGAALKDINTLIGFRKKALTEGTFMDKTPPGTTPPPAGNSYKVGGFTVTVSGPGGGG